MSLIADFRLPPILRLGCQVDYLTPVGAQRKLFVNCADHDSDVWPWNYFWTKTLNTKAPLLTSSNGYVRSAPVFTVQGSSTLGQTVVRGMFAYVASEPFSANIALSVSKAFTLDNDNVKLGAGLYSALKGDLVTSFVDTTAKLLTPENSSATETILLPATICPLVLWLSAAIQPTGEGQNKPLPSTSGSVSFEVLTPPADPI
jgi:hypothetical protein